MMTLNNKYLQEKKVFKKDFFARKKKNVCKKAKSTDDDPELNVCFIKIHEVGVEGECDTLSLFHTEILKVKGICN